MKVKRQYFIANSPIRSRSVRGRGRRLSLFFLLMVVLTTPLAVLAQQSATDAGNIERRIRESQPRRPQAAPDIPTPPPPKTTIPEAQTRLRFILAAVEFEGMTVFTAADFGPLYEEYLAREIGIEEVQRLIERITAHYREAGFTLSRAIAPPQQLDSGILLIRVIEGYLADVRFTGDTGKTDRLKGYADRLKLNRPMTQAALERYTLAIEDISGYSVEPHLTAIDEDAGQYALELKLTRKMIDGIALINNRGTPEIGRLQSWVSAGVNDALGLGERLQAGLFTVPNEPEESLYREITYTQPLGFSGTAFSITGAQSTADAGGSDEAFDIESEFEHASVALWHPMIRSRDENLWLRGTFDFRNFHETTSGRTTTNDRLRVFRARLTWWRDKQFDGATTISLEGSKGLDILGESTTGSLDLSRFDGESDFVKLMLDLTRDQHLYEGFWLQISAAGQFTNDRLLSSEEFSIGGTRFGRGYDFDEISGERGIAISIEPRHYWPLDHAWMTGLTVYGFYDWGVVWNDILNTGITRDTATSAGTGLRLFMAYDLRADLELAVPLTRPVASKGDTDPRLFFALTKNF